VIWLTPNAATMRPLLYTVVHTSAATCLDCSVARVSSVNRGSVCTSSTTTLSPR